LSFMESHSSDLQGAAPPTTEEARAALDTLGTDATRLAGRLVSPWWYHLTLGGLVAAAIGAQALPGVPAVTVVVLVIVWIPLMVRSYTSRYPISMTRAPARAAVRVAHAAADRRGAGCGDAVRGGAEACLAPVVVGAAGGSRRLPRYRAAGAGVRRGAALRDHGPLPLRRPAMSGSSRS